MLILYHSRFIPKFRYFIPADSFLLCCSFIFLVAYRQSIPLTAIVARIGHSSARVVSCLLPFQGGMPITLP